MTGVQTCALPISPTPALADEFDRALWTFSQLSFVPHVKANHVLAAETPIVIAQDDTLMDA